MPVLSKTFTVRQLEDIVNTDNLQITISSDGSLTSINETLYVVREPNTVTMTYTVGGVSYTVSNDVAWNQLADANFTGTIDNDVLTGTFATSPDAGTDVVISYLGYTSCIRQYEGMFNKLDIIRKLLYFSYVPGQETQLSFIAKTGIDDIWVDLLDDNNQPISQVFTSATSWRRIVSVYPNETMKFKCDFSLHSPYHSEGEVKIEIY